jgi:uncharacterized protein YggE
MKRKRFRVGQFVGLIAAVAVLGMTRIAHAQVGGGSVYNGQEVNPADVLRDQRSLTDQQLPPTLNSVFLDASVLMNVHADAYVAVFGVSEEGATLEDARSKVHTKLLAFRTALKSLGVSSQDISTDFIAQNRIYGFTVTNSVATEKVVGLELKENVSVRFRSQTEVDALVGMAAKCGIFDLIKVDYVLLDMSAIRSKILETAAKVIRQKRADYLRLFGMKLSSAPQLYAERFNAFYPTDMYVSYQAAEGDSVEPPINRRDYVIQDARKMRTFYYNPLSAKSFDRVIDPVVTDPVVQCILYLKLRFESGTDSRQIKLTR